MKINEKLKIDFQLNNKISKTVSILERLYKKSLSCSEEFKKTERWNLYERLYYDKITLLEVQALAAWRNGQINKKEFLYLTNRYEEY